MISLMKAEDPEASSQEKAIISDVAKKKKEKKLNVVVEFSDAVAM